MSSVLSLPMTEGKLTPEPGRSDPRGSTSRYRGVASMTVALLDHDRTHAYLLNRWLHFAGHRGRIFVRGDKLIRALEKDRFDGFVLEWESPDMNNLEILRRIRARYQWSTAVLFTSRHYDESNVVSALRHGADDYAVKPLNAREIVARLERIVRRARERSEQRQTFVVGAYEVNFNQRMLFRHGSAVDLTTKEFDLAALLLCNVGRVLSRATLWEDVWGPYADTSSRTIDTHVYRVRKKLGLTSQNGWRLVAIYRQGFLLQRLARALKLGEQA
jgi:DNA-binding response OmpR family regulator